MNFIDNLLKVHPFCFGFLTFQKEMKLEGEQEMSSLRKVMKNFNNYLYSVTAKEIEATLPRLKEVSFDE